MLLMVCLRQPGCTTSALAPASLASHTSSVLPLQAGPLMLLKQAYEARAAVRVVTRHARGVRGVATGAAAHVASHATTMVANLMAKPTPQSTQLDT